ncbi:MAG: hypothetical protein LBS58_04045, partial [Coriobacteriales bacterium]|nr:hypothetical protein [Coriobacteriales bacterium]
TWEGSQVHKVQELFQESTDAIISYGAENRLRLNDIYFELIDINARIANLNAQKSSLTTQYNNWDATHPST